MIKRVSDLTHLDWYKIWEMNVYEFLSYATFDVQYQKMKEKEIENWKRTH